MPLACKGFQRDGARVTGVETADGQLLPADEVVIAAGTHSKPLARNLGIKLRLEGVMGYSTGLQDPGVDLKTHGFLPGGRFRRHAL